MVLGDYNGDGRMDIAILGWDNRYATSYAIFFLPTTSPGQFTEQPLAMPVTYREMSMPVVGLFGKSFLKPDVVLNHSPNWGSPPQDQPSYQLAEINAATSGWFGPCAYPRAGQGFNVCSAGTPLNGSTLFSASADSLGKLRKIELWVDGKKMAEQHHTWDQHGYFNWRGTFAAGTHIATLYAADFDNRLRHYSFRFMVRGSACSAPSTASVHVCSPVNGSTVSSPVQASATATISGTLARMEIWVDGVKKYTETASLTESSSIALASGKHRFDFYALNTAGTKWLTTVYATVP